MVCHFHTFLVPWCFDGYVSKVLKGTTEGWVGWNLEETPYESCENGIDFYQFRNNTLS